MFFPLFWGQRTHGLANQIIFQSRDKSHSYKSHHLHIARTQKSGMPSLALPIGKWKLADFPFSAKDCEIELNSSVRGSKVISFLPCSVVKCFIFLTIWRIYCQSNHFSPWLHFILLNVHYFGWRNCLPKERGWYLRAENRSHRYIIRGVWPALGSGPCQIFCVISLGQSCSPHGISISTTTISHPVQVLHEADSCYF